MSGDEVPLLTGDKILQVSPCDRRVCSGLIPLASPYIWGKPLLRYPLTRLKTLNYCIFEGVLPKIYVI